MPKFTERYASIIMDAYKIVYEENACFTLDSFAKRTGWPANRHTRRALEQACKDERLLSYKMLFSDGHYRVVYFAPASEGRDSLDHFKRVIALQENLGGAS